MEAELVGGALAVVLLALSVWTLWSANAGRRIARWGRRRVRRTLFALFLVLASAFLLSSYI
jgi:hypothetical protein